MMKAGNRLITVALVVLTALPLGGCPPPSPYNYVLYNNSQADLIVHYADGQEKWDWRKALMVQEDELERMSSVKRDIVRGGKRFAFADPILDVQLGSRRLRYKLPQDVPDTLYVEKSDGIVSQYQLEADLNLYIVGPTKSFPASPQNPQPAGYPIRPDAGVD